MDIGFLFIYDLYDMIQICRYIGIHRIWFQSTHNFHKVSYKNEPVKSYLLTDGTVASTKATKTLSDKPTAYEYEQQRMNSELLNCMFMVPTYILVAMISVAKLHDLQTFIPVRLVVYDSRDTEL